MYSIRVDRVAELIDVRLSGLMTTGEVTAYIEELKRSFVANKLRSYSMLIDVTECPIQTQSMIEAMGRHMATMPKATALAVVVGGSLARMQVRRLFTQPYAKIFTDRNEALSWVVDK